MVERVNIFICYPRNALSSAVIGRSVIIGLSSTKDTYAAHLWHGKPWVAVL